MKVMAGVSSSLSYMRISILQVERETLSEQYFKEELESEILEKMYQEHLKEQNSDK